MHFTRLTDTEFTLLFSFAAFLAVVFYLLSFRRRIAVVATEPIWRKILGRRRTPFRKLLALLLQILVLFLLSLASAAPEKTGKEPLPPVAQVVILDGSASMSALDGKVKRIQRAEDLLKKIIESMGPRDRLLPMAMDDRCRPLTAWSGDKKTLLQSTGNLAVSLVPEDFPRCIDFAQRALDADSFGTGFKKRIAVISDHFHHLPNNAPYPILQTSVGTSMDNMAITAFEIHLRGQAASGYEVFVQISNFGSRPKRVTLSIHTEKSLLGQEVLFVASHQSSTRTYFLKQLDETKIMASITSAKAKNEVDGFSPDNRAYALLQKRQRPKVLLVTDGNLYLEKALELDPSIEVQVSNQASISSTLIDSAQVVVSDGLCLQASKPSIYFSPHEDSNCVFQGSDEIEFPELFPIMGEHPVTKGVTLVDIRINKARHLVPTRYDTVLMQDKDGPLVIAHQQGDEKFIAFGFDVAQSDLPLRIAFPILIHNCVWWLLGQQEQETNHAPIVGSTVFLPYWAGFQTTITGPDGKPVHPLRLGSKTLFRPRSPGFYELSSGGHSSMIAVNFHRPGESLLSSEKVVDQDSVNWQAGPPPRMLVEGFDTTKTNKARNQWPSILLAVAWLLLFDWVFFCFRILF